MKPIKLLIAAALVALFIILLVVGVNLAKNAQLGAVAQASPIIVSEIMTGNKGAVSDSLGNHPDYVELYNRSDKAHNIAGYTLSDRETDAWLIPDDTVLQPGEYLVIWCTGESVEDALVANFKLSSGEVLRFSDAGGNMLLSLEIPSVFSGYTYSYDLTSSSWVEMLPSPGYENSSEGIAAYEQSKLLGQNVGIESKHNGVYITELMAKNGSTLTGPDGTSCDWIELYNTTDETVDISGCGISDDETKPYKCTFPEGTVIAPHGYLVLYCTESDVEGYICLDFALSGSGETVIFTNAVGGILDLVTFESQTKDVSWARVYGADGDFDPLNDLGFEPCIEPTPGYPNTAAGWQAFQAVRYPDIGVHDICLNEILSSGYTYVVSTSGRPTDVDLGAWVELYNSSDTAVDLTGYALSDRLTDNSKWVFPDGTIIAAKGYLIVYMEGSLPLEWQDAEDVTPEQKAMTLSFGVSGAGETLCLFDAEKNLIDKVDVPVSRAGISYGRDESGEWVLFNSPTMNLKNEGYSKVGYCDTPTFSQDSGIYGSAQQVTITVPEGCYVTYTIYTPNIAEANYSDVEANKLGTQTCYDPTVDSTRYVEGTAISINSNTVLRARAFSEDGSRYYSDIASNTYVIVGAVGTIEAHNTSLPVVFLVTDPYNLWSENTGIYIKSDSYDEDTQLGANYNQSGREWERSTHFTYLSAGGSEVLHEQDLMIRIFGAYSRMRSQKGFALVARKGYGASSIDYPFFSNRPFDSYESLVLRASAQDNINSRIRDVLVSGLLDDNDIDLAVQAYVQCIVYLNGEYWGVYNLREKVSKFYIAQHYSVNDPDTITVLVGNGTLVTGDASAKADYDALISYCKERNCDLSNSSDYNYVCSKVDVENYALYCAMEIAVGNTDTGNIKWWRSTEKDNKWRWIVYDFCWAMNRNDDKEIAYTTGYRRNFFWKYFNPAGHGVNKGFSTVLSRSLLSNNEFVEIFLEACATMVNDVYSTENIRAKVDVLQDNIRDEMTNWDFPRWSLNYKSWLTQCDVIREYADKYPDYFLKYVKEYINENTNYRLTDEKMIELFGRTSNLD